MDCRGDFRGSSKHHPIMGHWWDELILYVLFCQWAETYHTIENHSRVQEQQLSKKCHFRQDPTQHKKNSDHGHFSAQNKGVCFRVFGVLQLRDIDTNLQTFWTSSIGLDLLGKFITDSSCDPMLHCHCKLHQLWFHLPSSKFHLILPLRFLL